MNRHQSHTSPPGRRRRRPRAGLVAIGLALTLALAGCGSEDEAPAQAEGTEATGATGASAASGGPSDAVLDFYQCLRDNGLDVPDPNGNGGIQIQGLDRDDPEQMAIIEDCAREHELGGPGGGGAVMRGGGSGGGQLADPDALIDFAECMRENGIDMPDPDPDGGLKMPEGMDRSAPEFQGAVDTCREHLAGGGVRVTR